MGDLSKLKIAVGQPELVFARPSVNLKARERMVERAVEAGADLLVMPGSLVDAQDVHLVVLNDSRIDVAGNAVHLEACGETYRIGLDAGDLTCDFAVYCDVDPWAFDSQGHAQPGMRFVPTIVLRPVGMRNIGKDVFAYDGGTTAYQADGSIQCVLRDDFEEDMALVQFSDKNRMQEPCDNKLLAALVKTLRRFDEQALPWEPKWIIGLSGGLDSSVVAVLLTLAFGSERVLGYNLATRFNSDATKFNAASLADALGIPMRNGSIEPLVDVMGAVLGQFGYEESCMNGLTLENVQARTRGHMLSTLAAIEGGVVVNNGNRVESALGYATLYGDSIGALAPIGDLTKTKLFELSHAINGDSQNAIIPENLLPRVSDDAIDWATPPSAELSEGQRDPMKWFYHDWLIDKLMGPEGIDAAACDVMERFLENRLADTEAGRWVRYYGLEAPAAFLDDLDWVMRSIRVSAFKRIQAPPAIRVMRTAQEASGGIEVQGDIEPSSRFENLRARLMVQSRQNDSRGESYA